MARLLDVRGEICPYPMMKAVEQLKKLKGEEALEVLTDHAPALSTIPWEAAKLGYVTTITSSGHAEWRLDLTRDASVARDPSAVLGQLAEQLDALGVAE
ncbi:MAG: sulfurtransferase TusA family protein [Chloroflexota bacterium]